MKIISGDREDNLNVSYVDSAFELKDVNGDIRATYTPVLKLSSTQEDPVEYKCYILYNSRNDYGENNIFQVKVPNGNKATRIGWIFPIQALESRQHEYVDDPHFLRYAYVALYQLLNKDDLKIEDDFKDEQLLLRDIVSMQETLLVIDKRNIAAIPNFDLHDYIPSLFSHGYSFSGCGNLYDSCEIVQEKHLHLKPISNLMRNKLYIATLFREMIPSARESISQFHLCYQIVEILIVSVFEHEIKQITIKMSQSVIGEDILKHKEMLDDVINEKHRVKRLFSSYCSYSTELKVKMKSACDVLLEKYGEPVPETAGESLYCVRCLLVHRCYLLGNEDMKLIAAINDPFYGIAIQMLLNFNTPVLTSASGSEAMIMGAE